MSNLKCKWRVFTATLEWFVMENWTDLDLLESLQASLAIHEISLSQNSAGSWRFHENQKTSKTSIKDEHAK